MFSLKKITSPGHLKPLAGLVMAIGFTVALVSGLMPGADTTASRHSISGGSLHQAGFVANPE